MAAASIDAVNVTGARSVSIKFSGPDGDSIVFADVAAAIIDPLKGGEAAFESSAIYAFFMDNEAANLANTRDAWFNAGIASSFVAGPGAMTAATLPVINAAALDLVGDFTIGSQARFSLSSSISA